MSRNQHIQSILALPFLVVVVVPFLLVVLTGAINMEWLFPIPFIFLSFMIGFLLIAMGLKILVQTRNLFVIIGKGTIAPWAPTKYLVVHGVYRYMRNPMIVGVLLMLLGEAISFGSLPVFLWFVLFGLGNHIYFIKSEEPGLIDRFGDEYLLYMKHVSRWIPRRTPWSPEGSTDDRLC